LYVLNLLETTPKVNVNGNTKPSVQQKKKATRSQHKHNDYPTEELKGEVDKCLPKEGVVPISDAERHNILPSTWAFKKKRHPNGRARKFKARFCCRGDRQLEGVDYFETYARPTVG
jgi:hypothetical protein